MNVRNPSQLFKDYTERKLYINALKVAEEHLPNKVREAAIEVHKWRIKDKVYFPAIEIAKKYLPDKFEQTVHMAYKYYTERKLYINALKVAEEHLPNKISLTAFLVINNLFKSCKSLLMSTNPKDSNESYKIELIYPLLKQNLEILGEKYLDEENRIFYYSEEGPEVFKLDIYSQISKLEDIAKKKWKNPEKFYLEERLVKAVDIEDYELAAKLRDEIKNLSNIF